MSTSYPPDVNSHDRCFQAYAIFRCSSASMYYTECKPKNKNRGGLGTRLRCCVLINFWFYDRPSTVLILGTNAGVDIHVGTRLKWGTRGTMVVLGVNDNQYSVNKPLLQTNQCCWGSHLYPDQVQVTLFAWSYAEIYIHLFVHSQSLSIVITEWVDDSDSQSENKRRGKALINDPKDTKIKQTGNALCSQWLQS